MFPNINKSVTGLILKVLKIEVFEKLIIPERIYRLPLLAVFRTSNVGLISCHWDDSFLFLNIHTRTSLRKSPISTLLIPS
jgi:hypothetical protein